MYCYVHQWCMTVWVYLVRVYIRKILLYVVYTYTHTTNLHLYMKKKFSIRIAVRSNDYKFFNIFFRSFSCSLLHSLLSEKKKFTFFLFETSFYCSFSLFLLTLWMFLNLFFTNYLFIFSLVCCNWLGLLCTLLHLFQNSRHAFHLSHSK